MRNPVTPEGYEALVSQLHHEKSIVRLQIVRDIEEARAHGDISENSEFEDAKERQAACDGRIRMLESALASAEVIDILKVPATDRAVFGCWVTIEHVDSGEQRMYRIVGEGQADADNNLISFRSPIGKALIGKSEGDEVEVITPSGKVTYEIVGVNYSKDAP
ncbi:MAG: transcription elongation factor GreA [Alphaproteobacteria bacterium]|nr:transcription elongation factor GreA [Alphaproteobacteria bacterium]